MIVFHYAHKETLNTRQMEVAYVSLVAHWDETRMAAKHTDTHTHINTYAHTVNISTLASANYELDSFVKENMQKSKLRNVPYTHCESVVQTTTAEDPPGEIPEYPLGDSTV